MLRNSFVPAFKMCFPLRRLRLKKVSVFIKLSFLQIELSSKITLETLKIAVELNISKLISKCKDIFLKELSVDNCCEFYMDAMNMCNDSGIASELINTSCQTFIEENASDVVHTQGFLYLSKDALTQLVSSDKVSLSLPPPPNPHFSLGPIHFNSFKTEEKLGRG
jgi:hypothetical protein